MGPEILVPAQPLQNGSPLGAALRRSPWFPALHWQWRWLGIRVTLLETAAAAALRSGAGTTVVMVRGRIAVVVSILFPRVKHWFLLVIVIFAATNRAGLAVGLDERGATVDFLVVGQRLVLSFVTKTDIVSVFLGVHNHLVFKGLDHSSDARGLWAMTHSSASDGATGS